jgi:hypothetical protein
LVGESILLALWKVLGRFGALDCESLGVLPRFESVMNRHRAEQ